MSKNESLKALEDAKQELEAAREVARLKLHLFSMDARRTWDDLEGKFQAFQEDLGKRGEEVGQASAETARDLARSIRTFVEKHI
jgi:vacuolar-type H+-ATPase subunit H